MMFNKSIFFLLVLLPLFSCKKDESTRPVQAELQLEVAGLENGRTVEPLLVTGGLLRIESLNFEGYRENGEDYFFTRTYADTMAVHFSSTGPAQITSFEMPQGVYKRIEIGLDIPALPESVSSSLNPNRGELRGGVEIWGNYVDVHGEAVPFLFLYSATDRYEFTAASSAGNQQVVVRNDSRSLGTLRFNPTEWMQLINPRMLQSAKITALEGVPTIIISKINNEHIYNLLASRIQTSTTLIFE